MREHGAAMERVCFAKLVARSSSDSQPYLKTLCISLVVSQCPLVFRPQCKTDPIELVRARKSASGSCRRNRCRSEREADDIVVVID